MKSKKTSKKKAAKVVTKAAGAGGGASADKTAGEAEGPRIIVRCELLPASKAALAETAAFHGMTQVSVLSRTIDFMASLPVELRAVALGHIPGTIKAEALKAITSHLAKTA